MDLSVIIVNYNTKDLTRKCLQSVFASKTEFSYEVFVSDNGSSDGSIEMLISEFPQASLLKNQHNIGFSKGNNVAIRRAGGRHILLLNSDTEVRKDTLDLSVKFLDAHPDAGAMGCKVLLPDGSLDPACRRRFPNPINAFYRLFGMRGRSDYNIVGPVDEEMEVDCIMGAYMMVPRAVIERVGMLDEEYFMYGEDIDWCWRIKKAGYKIVYYPKAEITHYKYGSSRLVPFRTIRAAHRAMWIFYRKNQAGEHNAVLNALVFTGIKLRALLVLTVNLFRSKKSVH